MLRSVMEHFHLAEEFKQAGYFETEHHKQLKDEIRSVIKLGELVAISGIVGSGKTTVLRQLRGSLESEKEVLVSKSLSVEKSRVSLTMLMMALFYDLSSEKEIRIPSQSEKRIRNLIELIRKQKKPVALFIDEAHDLHTKTLVSLKRLMEVVEDGGGLLSIVLAGHIKLKNDLMRPSLEEIGTRSTIFDLDGIAASKREYIEWLLEKCSKPGTKTSSIMTEEAVDLVADRLVTPLQIEHYITLALEEAYKIGVKPVSYEVIESVISKSINDLEPRITRYGYNAKTLSNALNIKPSVIKSFFHGQLSPAQSHEIQDEILSLGISL
jgi:type II secretory pathway predicted ATPase ExeA